MLTLLALHLAGGIVIVQEPQYELLLQARVLERGEATVPEVLAWNRDGTLAFYRIEESYHLADHDKSTYERYDSLCVYEHETGRVRNLYAGHLNSNWSWNGDYEFDLMTGNDYRPAFVRWSPDGSRILFFALAFLGASINADGNSLLDVDPKNGKLRVLSKGWRLEDRATVDAMMYDDTVVFSPDGSKLLLVIGPGRFMCEEKRIAVMDYPKGRPTFITGADHASTSPKWSPSGRRVVFVSNSEVDEHGEPIADLLRKFSLSRIWLMLPDGSGKRRLTNDSHYRDIEPSWVDDETIRFVREVNEIDWSGERSEWEIQRDGNGLRKLRNLPPRD